MGYGFFSTSELKKLNTVKIADSECGTCGLWKYCKTPKMKPTGEGKKKIMIVAEAPGEMEDARGIQLIGECGQLLRRHLFELDIDLDEDCYKTNSVCCRPEENAIPTEKQIVACRSRLFKEIRDFNPKVLILLGSIACKSVISELREESSGSINMWRGCAIPDQTLKCWVCSTFHPSYVLREERNRAVELIFQQDLKHALSFLETPVPDNSDMFNRINILTEKNAVVLFDRMNGLPPKMCAFDYETSGIKPHRKGHKIVCMSLCFSEKEAYSFMLTPKLIPYIKRFLVDKRVGKIASNMAFEESWSLVIFGVSVENFIWDTMVNTHVLDNRPGITSIKFQTYLRYGIAKYNSSVEKYLTSGEDKDSNTRNKGEEKDSNAFNKIDECDQLSLLKYCGLDSLFEYITAIRQMGEMADVPNFI